MIAEKQALGADLRGTQASAQAANGKSKSDRLFNSCHPSINSHHAVAFFRSISRPRRSPRAYFPDHPPLLSQQSRPRASTFAMAANKQGKMQGLINYRLRVTMMDGRQMAGQMLAFDKHMNLVLADTEEFRRVKRKPTKSAAPGQAEPQFVETEEKRTLGLTIVRGAHIVASTVEGPPPADPSARLAKDGPAGPGAPTMTAGPGITRPAGRGMPPTGLTGPAAGVGGPAPGFGFPGAPGGFPGAPPPGFGGRGGPRMF